MSQRAARTDAEPAEILGNDEKGREGIRRTAGERPDRIYLIMLIKKVAGGLGFEPRLAESESAVLPLDDPPSDARLKSGPITRRIDSTTRWGAVGLSITVPPGPCRRAIVWDL
jgi:hypothetical protein